MAGQSNMEGHSWNSKLIENTPKNMHTYYYTGFPNTKIMFYSNKGTNKSSEFIKVKLGQGYNTGSFGPEIGVAEELYTRNVENVFLIKYALGATSLYTDWSVDNMNSLYYEMVSYIYDQLVLLEEQEYDIKIAGFLWMQGEADAAELQSSAEVAKYFQHLSKFVGAFREEFEDYYGLEDKGIAFVDAGISDYSVYKFYSTVNQAKKDFSETNPDKNYYIDTIELGLEYNKDNTDYYHFDATSELELGRQFAAVLLDNNWI